MFYLFRTLGFYSRYFDSIGQGCSSSSSGYLNNGVNGNANNQQNSNANVNNNAANIIIAMPGKKRRRKRTAMDFVTSSLTSTERSRSKCLDMTSEAEIMTLPFLIFDIMKVQNKNLFLHVYRRS